MRITRHARLTLSWVLVGLAVLSLSSVSASSANVSHSYTSTKPIAVGSLVSLDTSKTDYVTAANTSNGSQLLGIVVTSNDSLLAVDATAGKVQVATTGTASALVSTLNGDINVGDQVSVSPFDGIGMKAESGAHVIGLAQTKFNSNSAGKTETVTDKNGHTKEIRVGFQRINIGVSVADLGASSKLNGLQRLVKSVTGRTLSMARIVTALIITIVALITLVTLIYGAIYGSIISIGRNPLAKFAVFRTLGSVLTMAALIAVVAGVTIFLLLH